MDKNGDRQEIIYKPKQSLKMTSKCGKSGGIHYGESFYLSYMRPRTEEEKPDNDLHTLANLRKDYFVLQTV